MALGWSLSYTTDRFLHSLFDSRFDPNCVFILRDAIAKVRQGRHPRAIKDAAQWDVFEVEAEYCMAWDVQALTGPNTSLRAVFYGSGRNFCHITLENVSKPTSNLHGLHCHSVGESWHHSMPEFYACNMIDFEDMHQNILAWMPFDIFSSNHQICLPRRWT